MGLALLTVVFHKIDAKEPIEDAAEIEAIRRRCGYDLTHRRVLVSPGESRFAPQRDSGASDEDVRLHGLDGRNRRPGAQALFSTRSVRGCALSPWPSRPEIRREQPGCSELSRLVLGNRLVSATTECGHLAIGLAHKSLRRRGHAPCP